MTKYEIAKKILDLLDYDGIELVNQIYKLSAAVKRSAEIDEFCDHDWTGLQGGY